MESLATRLQLTGNGNGDDHYDGHDDQSLPMEINQARLLPGQVALGCSISLMSFRFELAAAAALRRRVSRLKVQSSQQVALSRASRLPGATLKPVAPPSKTTAATEGRRRSRN